MQGSHAHIESRGELLPRCRAEFARIVVFLAFCLVSRVLRVMRWVQRRAGCPGVCVACGPKVVPSLTGKVPTVTSLP